MPPLQNLGHELFLLMVSLSRLKDRDRIARVFGEALSSLFEGLSFEFVTDEPAETSFAIEAATSVTRLGWVAVSGPWDTLAADRAALIRNAVKMLALILENRLQAEELAGENDRLELAVQARTEALVRRNKELRQEIEVKEKAQALLRKSEERLRLAQEAANAGAWEWDLRTNETAWSEEMWALYGLPPHSCVPSHDAWRATVHPDDVAETERVLRDASSRGDELNIEWSTNAPNGACRRLMLRGRPVVDERGKPVRYVGIVIDVTDKKKMEEALVQNEKYRAVADLTMGVAHNFNNLLQILLGAAECALMDMEDGDLRSVRRNIEKILEGVKVGANIVVRLNAYARGDERSGKETELCDLSDLVREAVERSGPWWRERPEHKRIRIRIKTDLACACTVRGNKNELCDVVFNLIKNSIEALPEGGDIGIDTWVEGGDSVLRIKDNGKGIPKGSIHRLYTPFFTTHAEVGRGLGLASVQRIVVAHKGTIGAESREGEGSTFTLAFPYAPSPS